MTGKKGGGAKGPAQSAITGKFVTPGYAATHPNTTIVHRPKPSGGSKGGKSK